MQISTGSRSRRRRLPLTLTAVATAAASTVLGLAGPASAAGHVSYPSSVPHWANSSNDQGPAVANGLVEGELYLNLQNAAGATQLATDVAMSTRPSVTPQAWIDTYAPTQAQYDRVVQYLQGFGFQITGTPASRLFVVFRGPASKLAQAFSAPMDTFAVAGHSLIAPASAPQLPADVAAVVSGMEIDQGRLLTRPDSAQPGDGGAASTSTTASIPCSHSYGDATAQLPEAYGQTSFPTYICGYDGTQLRSAYGVTGTGLNGAGQTVAIIDAYASPSIVQDVAQYTARHGEPALANYTQEVPAQVYDEAACGYPSGWQGEQTLDVEAVHNIAPAAGIHYVGAFNCGGGIDVALSSILDNATANIVSNSYGNVGEAVPADAIRGQENQHLQAVAEGIGLYYSSGDYGDEKAALGTPQPDYEASSPWVTAVGGTSTGIDKTGSVAKETGWGSHRDQVVQAADGTPTYLDALPGKFRFGAGGGASTVFAKPFYQQHVAGTQRVSPDVAADADPYTGMVIGISPITNDSSGHTGAYTEETYGGTSLASPLVAAEMALVQQRTGRTIGFANPALYGNGLSDTIALRDVSDTAPFPLAFGSTVTGNSYLVTGNEDTSLAVAKGYDDVTGLGAITFVQGTTTTPAHSKK